MTPSIKLFLASSEELKEDRDKFEIAIRRQYSTWRLENKPYLDLEIWETASEAMSATRSQDEYNKTIRETDIFIMLVWTKAGKFTEEEFNLARQLFLLTGKPKIIVYQKHSEIITDELKAFLQLFRQVDKEYFHGHYQVFSDLQVRFQGELEKYLHEKYPKDLAAAQKHRRALLEGLQRRYARRKEKKMEQELGFKLQLHLRYDADGTTPAFARDYFIEGYEGKSAGSFEELVGEFERKIRRLMILGDPGSGKTVLLLEFAEIFVTKALENPMYPLPVIMNLATWNDEFVNFDDWLEQNLMYAAGEYGISRRYAKELAAEGNFLLLLDGLDEIREPDRASCLHLLHQYINRQVNAKTAIQYPHLIICSRKEEYRQLSADAPVKASLGINPLTSEQVTGALAWKKDNDAASILLKRITAQPEIAEHLQTAFQVHMALHLVEDYDFQNFDIDRLLHSYIEQEIQQVEGYGKETTARYLSFLAEQLTTSKKGIIFELMDVQPDWLKRPAQYKFLFSFLYSTCLSVIFTLIIYALANNTLLNIFLFFFPMIFLGVTANELINLKKKNRIASNEIMRFSIKPLKQKRLFRSLLSGWKKLLLMSGLMSLLAAIYYLLSDNKQEWGSAIFMFFVLGIFIAGYFSLVLMAINLINGLFVVKKLPTIRRAYSKLISSAHISAIKISIMFLAFFFLISLGGKNKGVSFDEDADLQTKVVVIPLVFLLLFLCSLFFAFLSGPLFKHFCLRWQLWLAKKVPLRYRSFLNRVSRTGLMERDGGQWRFRHQLIQDYFAGRRL